MTTNKGILGDRLSDLQYDWLEYNLNSWYNDNCVLFVNNSFNTVFNVWFDSETEYWEMDQMTRDGVVSHSRTNDPSNYRATVWSGNPGAYIYLYGNNGYVEIDSVETLNLSPIPNERIDYSQLIKIKDTTWKWTNLKLVLKYLKDIKAIPEDMNELNALSYKWDSLMAEKFFSSFMIGWVKGQIHENDVANYLSFFYGDKWNRLYDTMKEEYDALFNYDMTEETTENESGDNTNSNTFESSNDGESTNDVKSKIYGFNSETASNDSETENPATFNETTSSSNDNEGTFSREQTRTIERKGNIGTITSQDLIDKEWEVRRKLVLEEIFHDILNEMTLSIYDFDC